MPTIQIDMFEVQLGAAILLQFDSAGGPIRVLADAGIKASGYPPERVLERLRPILDDSGGRRIDLIIGTHYDEDHLNGLVPIIDDPTIEIGEAWMPPTANDTVPHARDATVSDADLLPQQFYGETAETDLESYLRAKQADCEVLRLIERPNESEEGVTLSAFRSNIDTQRWNRGESITYFRNQLAELLPADDCDHGTEQEIDADPEIEEAIQMAGRSAATAGRFANVVLSSFEDPVQFSRMMNQHRPDAAAAQARSLANIRRAAAKDAINATALFEVMRALRRRRIPVRSEIIENGTPKRYAWRKRERRFISGNMASDGPVLKLLGPSRGLVNKHWNRLPVEDAARVALSFLSEIRSITPSNELSYIARFGFSEQGILVSGDAGCVDFKESRNKYYPDLLEAMLPLHVVQVAHHAGNNAHFYRVLAAAKFPEQTDRSLMLLSHKTDDIHRPSSVFREFLLSTLRQGDDVQLLFTSRPQRGKVEDYLSAIHPLVGAQNDVGDIRIVFDRGRWEVKSHAVAP